MDRLFEKMSIASSQECLSHMESSTQKVIQAIRQNLPLELICKILTKKKKKYRDLFSIRCPAHLQWQLIKAAIEVNRSDILDMLLDRGISPDIQCPEMKEYEPHGGTSALQIVAECENLDLVKVLLYHKVNVNFGKEFSLNSPSNYLINCKSALCIAFEKDNPALMKLLIKGYDRSSFLLGRGPLLLAFEALATKCIASLLSDPELEVIIDPSEVPLEYGVFEGMNIFSLLYKVGLKQGIYTNDDLNDCLIAVTKSYSWRLGCQAEREAVDFIDMLLGLGAKVNFTCNLFGTNISVLDTLLHGTFPNGPTDTNTLAITIASLLGHGATASFRETNKFFVNIFTEVIPSYNEKLADHFLDMMSLLYSKKYMHCIKGFPTRRIGAKVNIPERYSRIDLPICNGLTLSHTMEEFIRLTILNVDICLASTIIAIIDKTNPLQSHSYLSSYIVLRKETSVLPHTAYQSSIHLIEGLVQPKSPLLLEHFPLVRSLQELSRMTILEHLHFPRSYSAETLMLPKMLIQYVCLVEY